MLIKHSSFAITVESVPTQSPDSSVKTPESISYTYTLYSVMGEPLSVGRLQETFS